MPLTLMESNNFSVTFGVMLGYLHPAATMYATLCPKALRTFLYMVAASMCNAIRSNTLLLNISFFLWLLVLGSFRK